MLKRCWKIPRIRKRARGALLLLGLAAPLVEMPAEVAAAEALEARAAAEGEEAVGESATSESAAAEAEAAAPPSRVTLDQLLTLPSALPVETSEYGGLTRGEWSSRFASAESDVADAKASLQESLDRLSELAGKTTNWKVGAPGAPVAASNENSPVDYALKQEIRRKREDVERAERSLRELIVEANLAGVPKDWQKAPESAD